mmetsp:Transcript_10393/g.34399  ORF Transcript_10393/g.34399 Transcript_10393/m.34399 type:complete len:417 (+) Transcript_10393:991-2241(+)
MADFAVELLARLGLEAENAHSGSDAHTNLRLDVRGGGGGAKGGTESHPRRSGVQAGAGGVRGAPGAGPLLGLDVGLGVRLPAVEIVVEPSDGFHFDLDADEAQLLAVGCLAAHAHDSHLLDQLVAAVGRNPAFGPAHAVLDLSPEREHCTREYVLLLLTLANGAFHARLAVGSVHASALALIVVALPVGLRILRSQPGVARRVAAREFFEAHRGAKPSVGAEDAKYGDGVEEERTDGLLDDQGHPLDVLLLTPEYRPARDVEALIRPRPAVFLGRFVQQLLGAMEREAAVHAQFVTEQRNARDRVAHHLDGKAGRHVDRLAAHVDDALVVLLGILGALHFLFEHRHEVREDFVLHLDGHAEEAIEELLDAGAVLVNASTRHRFLGLIEVRTPLLLKLVGAKAERLSHVGSGRVARA